MAGFFRLVRRTAGVLLLFVCVTCTNETHTDAAVVREETRVGAWFSPWYTKTETTTKSAAATPEGGSIESSDIATTVTFTMASWSWPILVAALALIFWPSRRKPSDAKGATASPSPVR